MTGPDDREGSGTSPYRRVDRRKTYNRRVEDREVSPPYFEIFDRIANALERIEIDLRQRHLTLPDTEPERRSQHS